MLVEQSLSWPVNQCKLILRCYTSLLLSGFIAGSETWRPHHLVLDIPPIWWHPKRHRAETDWLLHDWIYGWICLSGWLYSMTLLATHYAASRFCLYVWTRKLEHEKRLAAMIRPPWPNVSLLPRKRTGRALAFCMDHFWRPAVRTSH